MFPLHKETEMFLVHVFLQGHAMGKKAKLSERVAKEIIQSLGFSGDWNRPSNAMFQFFQIPLLGLAMFRT